jgi:hypothetical protein
MLPALHALPDLPLAPLRLDPFRKPAMSGIFPVLRLKRVHLVASLEVARKVTNLASPKEARQVASLKVARQVICLASLEVARQVASLEVARQVISLASLEGARKEGLAVPLRVRPNRVQKVKCRRAQRNTKKDDQAGSIRISFRAIERHNRVVNPVSSREKVSTGLDGKLQTRLMLLYMMVSYE